MADDAAVTADTAGAAEAAAAAQSPRARYRVQVRAEIKKQAWEQIGRAGASALSLSAIAREIGVTGPALYRYFRSRDALLTELIEDAYRSLADTFRATAAATAAAGHAPDLVRLGHAMRGWALADPQRYFLVFGTPVPGYQAPQDITALASDVMEVMLDASAALPAATPGRRPAAQEPAGDAPDPTAAAVPPRAQGAATAFETHLAGHRQWDRGHPAPPQALRRALAWWTRLHGVLSLELAGHFTGMSFDPAQLFESELSSLLD